MYPIVDVKIGKSFEIRQEGRILNAHLCDTFMSGQAKDEVTKKSGLKMDDKK